MSKNQCIFKKMIRIIQVQAELVIYFHQTFLFLGVTVSLISIVFDLQVEVVSPVLLSFSELSPASAFWAFNSSLSFNLTCWSSLMNQITVPYNNTAMTNKLTKCIDFVKKMNVANEMSNKMNDAWVALINAGVVPGVNIDSHNSTIKAIMGETSLELWSKLLMLTVPRWLFSRLRSVNQFFTHTKYANKVLCWMSLYSFRLSGCGY